MFSFLGQNAPQFETRKALVVINLQNDSFNPRNGFCVTQPSDFVEKVKMTVPYFRKMGDIVWVRTEIEVSASVPERESSNKQASSPSSLGQGANGTGQVDDSGLSQEPALIFDQYYPSSQAKAAMRKAAAKSRADQRQADTASHDDEDYATDNYLQKPRKGQLPQLYRQGSPGADILDSMASVVDESNDMMIAKSHYSAFDTTSLLMSLRMKLVTHIYLCGCLSNVSIYATAADAVRHGFEVSVVEDCMGYRSEDMHVDAMRKMADLLGVSGVDSDELIEDSGGRPPPDADEGLFSGPGIDGIRNALPSLETVSSSPSEPMEGLLKTADPNVSSGRSAASISAVLSSTTPSDRRESLEPPSSTADTLSVVSRQVASEPPLPRHTSDRKDNIAEGDTSIIFQALSEISPDDAFRLIKEEVDWQAMRHRSGEVPRRVAVQGDIGSDGSVPTYRHPADESPPLLEFSPTVRRVRDELQLLLKQRFNHCLIQLYRSGQDNISEHSDKSLDIVRGSSIINLSLGAQRTMTLRTKKSVHTDREPGKPVSRQSEKIPMPHNSVFVLGPRTNTRWLHGIRPDKRLLSEKTPGELAFDGERISLTFRNIGTFTDVSRSIIWGQGARSKFQATAGKVSTTNSTEMESMICAFGKENQQADFDWDTEYGEGFDVMNLVCNSTTLFLCTDEIANLRVKMAIRQRNLPCHFTNSKSALSKANSHKSSPLSRRTIFALSGDEAPLFRDMDASNSEILGDFAILFYISKFYPITNQPDPTSTEVHRVASNVFARMTQANELLFLWQELKGTPLSASTRATHQVRRMSTDPQSTAIPEEQSPTPMNVITTTALSGSPSHDSSISTAPTSHPLSPSSNHTPLESFESELETWEEYAEETEFMAGDVIAIVDCAFWPVLNEIVRRWEGWSERKYPYLADYWGKVGAMESTRAAMSLKGDDK